MVVLLFARNDAYTLAAIAAEHPELGTMSVEWFAFFMTTSAFCNAGFSVLSSNLIVVCDSRGVLICLGILVLLGNTLYPVAIRVLITLLSRLSPSDDVYRELLDHPRKYYTHMLSHTETVLVMAIVAVFTFVEFFLFLGLDYNEPYLAGYSGESRVNIGWFQSISTRTAGFNALDLTQLNPAMQVIYLLMMYIAAMPQIFVLNASVASKGAAKATVTTSRGIKVVLAPSAAGARQRSVPAVGRAPSARPMLLAGSGPAALSPAVAADDEPTSSAAASFGGGGGLLDTAGGNGRDGQEEWWDEGEEEDLEGAEGTGEGPEAEEEEENMELLLKEKPLKAQPVSAQAVSVLGEELPALFLALLAICIADGSNFKDDPLQKLSVWPTLFELASAYGTVGLSLGYPGSVLSFTAFLSTFSRFVVIGVMLAGRMRKLPLSIDPAVRVKNVVELELQERELQAEERGRQAEARARELRESEAEAERLRRMLGRGGGAGTLRGGAGTLRADGNTQTRSRRSGNSVGMRSMPQEWAASAGGRGGGGGGGGSGGGAVRRSSVTGAGRGALRASAAGGVDGAGHVHGHVHGHVRYSDDASSASSALSASSAPTLASPSGAASALSPVREGSGAGGGAGAGAASSCSSGSGGEVALDSAIAVAVAAATQ